MNDNKKTAGITAQTALYAAAAVLFALLGWIGTILQKHIELNREDINKLEHSITVIETRLENHSHQTVVTGDE